MSEDDVIQAGELALGVLDGDERAVALRRVLADPAFAAQVTRWRRHLAALIAAVPPAAAPAALERRVLARTRTHPHRASRWRLATAAATLVAACLAVVTIRPGRMVAPPAPPSPARVLVAALSPPTSAPRQGTPFSAVYDARGSRIVVVGAAPWPANRSAELWVIVPGATPRALGLLARGPRSSVAVRDDRRAMIGAGATLAVSIEPSGGSPTGLPTGPVVASGGLVSG